MKKIIWCIPLIIVAIASFYYFNKKQVTSVALKERSQAIEKTSTSKRAPASVPTSQVMHKQATPEKIQERKWVGNKKMPRDKIIFVNSPKKEWKTLFMKKISRGLPADVDIEVQDEESLVILEGKMARNTEQVVVIYNSSAKRNSYRAMVDSQSGKIIRTWDHTIHEDLRKPASLSGLPLPID